MKPLQQNRPAAPLTHRASGGRRASDPIITMPQSLHFASKRYRRRPEISRKFRQRCLGRQGFKRSGELESKALTGRHLVALEQTPQLSLRSLALFDRNSSRQFDSVQVSSHKPPNARDNDMNLAPGKPSRKHICVANRNEEPAPGAAPHHLHGGVQEKDCRPSSNVMKPRTTQCTFAPALNSAPNVCDSSRSARSACSGVKGVYTVKSVASDTSISVQSKSLHTSSFTRSSSVSPKLLSTPITYRYVVIPNPYFGILLNPSGVECPVSSAAVAYHPNKTAKQPRPFKRKCRSRRPSLDEFFISQF